MPDISMCWGKDCPLKETCYRHKAKPDEFRQMYFMNPPHKDRQCDYYWEIEIENKRYDNIHK